MNHPASLGYPHDYGNLHMGGSINKGTPKSSNLMGFSLLNNRFWGTPMTTETSTCDHHLNIGQDTVHLGSFHLSLQSPPFDLTWRVSQWSSEQVTVELPTITRLVRRTKNKLQLAVDQFQHGFIGPKVYKNMLNQVKSFQKIISKNSMTEQEQVNRNNNK